jgi:ATP-dependent Clp protease ATP-binding subunit ClpB
MLAARRLTMDLSPEARKAVVDAGYEPRFGARPLRRAIQRHLQDPLSMAILEGDYGEGDTIVVTLQDPAHPEAGLAFHRRAKETPADGSATTAS